VGEAILVMGFPAAGKTTEVAKYHSTHVRLNRDELGGSVRGLANHLKSYLARGEENFVLDNTFGTIEQRAPVIKVARKYGLNVKAVVIWADKRFTKASLQRSFEEAQFNAVTRMIRNHGSLLSNKEIKAKKDPNTFPSVTLFSYKKNFEKPSHDEGFDRIIIRPFVRELPKNFINKAIILDYDGTLRVTKSGEKYPKSPDDVEVLPGRAEKLRKLQLNNYLLLGISNQSGIGKGDLPVEIAEQCFEATNQKLGVDIEYKYCPHNSFPVQCYCRKPQTGLGVTFIEKYKLNPSECIYVGDMTSDKTFAQRCGFQFKKADRFFN